MGENSQLRVNPGSLEVSLIRGNEMLAEIANADETVEDAASAEGAESESSTDYQALQNPDFYVMRCLVNVMPDGHVRPDVKAIEKIADIYFKG